MLARHHEPENLRACKQRRSRKQGKRYRQIFCAGIDYSRFHTNRLSLLGDIIRAEACPRKKHPVRAVEQCSPYQRCCCWHRFMPQKGGPRISAGVDRGRRPTASLFSPAAAHSTAAGHSSPKQGCVTAIMFPRAFGQIYARVIIREENSLQYSAPSQRPALQGHAS
jgi:hypothetical protein